jgi:hypothetical protein
MPTFSYVNLNFQQEVRLPKNLRATVSFNIENLFDQMTATSIGTTPFRDALNFNQCSGGTAAANRLCADRAFFAGFDTRAIMAAQNAANPNSGRPNALYKLDSGYQGARSARFQFKLTF